jgi:hypothetical protein
MSAAAGIDADVAGVYVRGIGEGRNCPTILFTATAADIDIDAANITFDNFHFDVTGIDAVVAPIDVNAADFVMKNCDILMADSGGQATEFILTATAADRMKFYNNRVRAPNAGANNAISIVGTPNGIEIYDNDITGDFADACIHNPTGNVATDMRIHDNILQNDQTGDHAVELVSACTGLIHNNKFVTDAHVTTLDKGSCKTWDNEWFDSSDIAADVDGVPFPPNADYNPLLGYHVSAADANSPQGTVRNIFTIVTGRVLVTRLVGQVGTIIQTASSLWKLTHNPTVGSSVDLAADLEMNAFNAGSIIHAELDGTAIIGTDGQETVLADALGVLQCELDVGVIEWESGESTSGTCKWDLWYWPIEDGAHVLGS